MLWPCASIQVVQQIGLDVDGGIVITDSLDKFDAGQKRFVVQFRFIIELCANFKELWESDNETRKPSHERSCFGYVAGLCGASVRSRISAVGCRDSDEPGTCMTSLQ